MRFAIREHLLKIPAYIPGKPIEELKRELGPPYVTKLASNENPLGPSPMAVEAIVRAAADAHLYPDGSGYELREALAESTGIAFDQIVLGNGSDELIHYLSVLLLDADSEIIMGDPGFSRYKSCAQIENARIVKVPLDADERHDVEAIAGEITDKTRVIWIANPHNPTGTITYRDEIDYLLSKLPDGAALVLDEAYYEFVQDDRYPSSAEYLRRGERVVGLRTFSKAYGLAGLRIGYGFFPPELAEATNRVREPFNANSIAQKAALAALSDIAHLEASIAVARESNSRVASLLERSGARVTPSHTNFVWADLGRPARPLYEELLAEGVIIRTGDIFGRPDCIRVSAGTPDQLDHLERALQAVTNGVTPA